MATLADLLVPLKPCSDAIPWLSQFSETELEACWNETDRGDWLIWLLCELGASDATLRKIAVLCALEVVYLCEDPRSLEALCVAWAYAEGNATREELEAAWAAARDAAWDAAGAAARDAARDVAWDVAWAARDAAWDAAWAAGAAAWAAGAAAWAARDAARDVAWDVAWAAARARQADIVRDLISFAEVRKLLETKLPA